MKCADYMARIKAGTATGTTYAAAKKLGVNDQTARNWTSGRSLPDAYGCLRIAEALNLPLEQVVADIEREREKDEARRKDWETLARKYAASVLIAGYTAIGTIAVLWHSPAEAALLTPARAAINDLPIMRRWLCSLREALKRRFARFPAQGFALGS
jgi:transcriptional regulator with XRE-family HTH domain